MVINFIKIYLIVDFLIIFVGFFLNIENWFINTQISFFSSMMIITGSFLAYKKSIETQVKTYESLDDKDELDKIDDKFELFSDDKIIENDKEKTDTELILEEQAKAKKGNWKNIKYSRASASIYRIIGYTFLVISFLYLVKNNLFVIFPYIIGLVGTQLATLIVAFLSKK